MASNYNAVYSGTEILDERDFPIKGVILAPGLPKTITRSFTANNDAEAIENATSKDLISKLRLDDPKLSSLHRYERVEIPETSGGKE